MQGILGIKKEQTQKFRVDGKRIPVTIVEVNTNPVTAIKTIERDGYTAVQLGYGTAKNPNKPMQGHMKGANVKTAPQFLREVRTDATSADTMPQVGDFISLEQVLEAGDVIDVTGVSKGKGFAGGVKRYHFKGGPRTHGQSDRERAPGSIGQTTTPGRVYKGKRMAGKMGFETVTMRNLTVAGIDGNILYIEGLVPGPLGALISVEKTNKKDKKYADLIDKAVKVEESQPVEEEAVVEPVQEAVASPAEVTPEEAPVAEVAPEEPKTEELVVAEEAQVDEKKVEEAK